ncbi:acetyl-CoA carboxylase biotin carboxylase subunit [Denitromonas ohlonensis]|uniref:Biotin carboxylase n=2 Tax=Denitromonas TaxID=139331 RepID=A0A558E778_9RHOO|nr:acetyl-CoA carboxylase biotin carboxylase subunit [Denitromonas ohlonensis]TVO67071.1 acetyl-CoA carboxylase biotin carboxylase subunit [Denitromonas ohlonensis]TVO79131.1 acetyl-CoA carboxylase biotin carboxylase subunit [Denitromonas ohlonensis]TVT50809.1 MAG: acetyl-CoA carboxylase biotin carboxylase subunit [Denitromonas halophila]TVT69232.1 MAG: acetyl-CoA carboxylase biotin carboxylase subunit [Denitromonas halophila]
MFKKILIANRGEIACRVIKTAQKMGIKTVAVYSEADKRALFVALADEAVCIGPAASAQSYLVADKIIAACKQTGAEAVHPGYGFLSENADFSRRLEEEGIKFIGPKHYSIAKMGDKIESKKLALDAKVNTIPGHNEAISGPDEAVKIAQGIGYPVMIKASAGGGGKGLRVAFNDKEAHEGFSSCVSEAKNAFGDDRVFIEKYVLEPRHIEIQLLGDSHGNYVYLNERDCSIQRRHQKVIEEAPSPFVDPAMRKAMGEQAVALARAVNYESAGTVEFVVGADKSFYFLEMNTRLQVEHPVTEYITGVDLVEQMIRVAYGEKLAFSQADVKLDGWSMECRINAEDPFRGFLPSTGRLVRFDPPAEREDVRVDTGVYDGGEISMFYDSMIAKLIVHGKDRDDAIQKMRDALNEFVIRGISSNIPFQAALLQHPRFCSGNFNTGFMVEEYPDGFDASMVPHDDPALLASVATFARMRYIERAVQISGQMAGHGRSVKKDLVVLMAGVRYPVSVEAIDGGMRIRQGDKAYDIVSDWTFRDLLFKGTVNGAPICLQIERRGLCYHISHFGLQVQPMVMTGVAASLLERMPEKQPPDLSKYLLSPMPGLLREVAVQPGQEIKAGQKLAVIEAMKMENVLKAEQDSVVKKVVAHPGASLTVDEIIIEFE